MTIIAAFNAVLVGGAALILGVPLAGTIAVVTFAGAYVPVRRRVGGRRLAVLIALGTWARRGAHHGRRRAAGERCAPADHPTDRDGRDARLNPLVVLVVTIGAGALFGMVGLTLAAPLTSAAMHVANELQGRSNELAVAEIKPLPDG